MGLVMLMELTQASSHDWIWRIGHVKYTQYI